MSLLWNSKQPPINTNWNQAGKNPQRDAHETQYSVPTSGLSSSSIDGAGSGRFGPFFTSNNNDIASSAAETAAYDVITENLSWKVSVTNAGFDGGGGRVYSVNNGSLIANDQDDGSQLWSKDLDFGGTNIGTGPVYVGANSAVYIYNDEDTVFSVDATDGSENWSVTPSKTGSTSGGACYSSSNDDVYLVVADDLLAFNASDGTEQWAAGMSGNARGTPCYGDDHIFVMDFSGDAYSIAASDGSIEWTDTWPEFAQREHSPAYDGTKAYFPGYGTENSEAKLLLAMNMDGTRAWTFTGDGDEHGFGGPSIDANDIIWFGVNGAQTIYGVDTGGTEQAKYTSQTNQHRGTPAIADGELFVNGNGNPDIVRLS